MQNCILHKITPPVQDIIYAKQYTFYNLSPFLDDMYINLDTFFNPAPVQNSMYVKLYNPAPNSGQYVYQTLYLL